MVNWCLAGVNVGSVWGGANGKSATPGEGTNTVGAHRVVCGDTAGPAAPGFFRGGRDLCAKAKEDGSVLAETIAEVAALRDEVATLTWRCSGGGGGATEVAGLRAEVAELKAMVNALLRAPKV